MTHGFLQSGAFLLLVACGSPQVPVEEASTTEEPVGEPASRQQASRPPASSPPQEEILQPETDAVETPARRPDRYWRLSDEQGEPWCFSARYHQDGEGLTGHVWASDDVEMPAPGPITSLAQLWNRITFSYQVNDNGSWTMSSPQTPSRHGGPKRLARCQFDLALSSTFDSEESCLAAPEENRVDLGSCAEPIAERPGAEPVPSAVQRIFANGGAAFALENDGSGGSRCRRWILRPETNPPNRESPEWAIGEMTSRALDDGVTTLTQYRYEFFPTTVRLYGPNHTTLHEDGTRSGIGFACAERFHVQAVTGQQYILFAGERWYFRRQACEAAGGEHPPTPHHHGC